MLMLASMLFQAQVIWRIPHFTVREGDWQTRISLVNPSSIEVPMLLRVYPGDGSTHAQKSVILAPGGSWSAQLDQELPLPAATGWVEIQAPQLEMGILVTLAFLPSGAVVSLPALDSRSASQRLALMPPPEQGGSALSTGFVLLNPQTDPCELQLIFHDPAGTLVALSSPKLPPHSTWIALLEDLLPQGISSRGWLEVVADVPLHAMCLGFTSGNAQMVALPALPVTSLDSLQNLVEAHYLAFPHAGVVGGFSSSPFGRQVVAAGLADIENSKEMTALHAGEIGSVSKTFVAALVLLQAERALVNLDSPLALWFPEFPRSAEITLRMLLNHTSGIPDYTQTAAFQADFAQSLLVGDFRTWSCEEILAYVEDVPPLFPPGSAFSYGNTGYVLAAAILERSAGSSLAVLLRARILDPLDLRHTWLQDVEPARQPAWTGYMLDVPNGTAFAATHRYHRSAVLGAAGIASTPQDLLRFFQALFAGELLSAESLAQMTAALPSTMLSPEYGYGLGLALTLSEGRVVEAGHNGNWIDGTSAVIHSLVSDHTIVVQCNHNQGTQTQALAAKLRQLGGFSRASAKFQGAGANVPGAPRSRQPLLNQPEPEHPRLENHPLFRVNSRPARAQAFVW